MKNEKKIKKYQVGRKRRIKKENKKKILTKNQFFLFELIF